MYAFIEMRLNFIKLQKYAYENWKKIKTSMLKTKIRQYKGIPLLECV